VSAESWPWCCTLLYCLHFETGFISSDDSPFVFEEALRW
jgi:hypothetical protein